MLAYGRNLTATRMTRFLGSNMDRILIGYAHGSASLVLDGRDVVATLPGGRRALADVREPARILGTTSRKRSMDPTAGS
ncbi:MAG: hypothetical protein MJB57_14830 [Gemmatimonadetes bacterium]|nr:hypothetical protein [Gemmatimonadota bacterium]